MAERRDQGPFPQATRSAEDRPRRPDPLARLVGPSRAGRRLTAALVAGVVLILIGWLVLRAVHSAAAWLHDRAEFAISFDRIDLEPAPPDAYRGGREGILARVKAKAKLDEPIRVLDQDLDELGRKFPTYSPWVARCLRVERAFPDRITVRLTYRKPVARLDMGRGDEFLAIADDGTALPGEEIKSAVARDLIRIEGFKTLIDTRPGLYFEAPEILAASHLARWLGERGAGAEPNVESISVSKGKQKLFLSTRSGLGIHWGSAPGDEADGEPRAQEKYDRLTRFLKLLDERESRRAPHVKVIWLSLGEDKIMVWTHRRQWVRWGHAPGEETGAEPKAVEKLERLIQWEDTHSGASPKDGDVLDLTTDPPRYGPVK